jgi:hypothetical protein
MRLKFLVLLAMATSGAQHPAAFAQDAARRLYELEQRVGRLESEVRSRRPALADSRVQRWVQAVADLFSRRAMRDSLALQAIERERLELLVEETRQLERTALDREIEALLSAGSDVGEALPASLLDRSQRLLRTPAGLSDLRRYQELLWQLNAGKALLARAPEGSSKRKARELEALSIDGRRYPGLEADRQKLIVALDGYCERAVQLAKVIRTAPEGRSEAERVNYLARYQAIQYPYLQQQLEQASRDPRFRLVVNACP